MNYFLAVLAFIGVLVVTAWLLVGMWRTCKRYGMNFWGWFGFLLIAIAVGFGIFIWVPAFLLTIREKEKKVKGSTHGG